MSAVEYDGIEVDLDPDTEDVTIEAPATSAYSEAEIAAFMTGYRAGVKASRRYLMAELDQLVEAHRASA